MEQNVTGNDLHVEGDAGQSFVVFEADRIAQRRVFEDDQGAFINKQTTIS